MYIQAHWKQASKQIYIDRYLIFVVVVVVVVVASKQIERYLIVNAQSTTRVISAEQSTRWIERYLIVNAQSTMRLYQANNEPDR